jgi:hypothetical protein
MKADRNGQSFITVGPVRVTYVKAAKRRSKDWAGKDVIRIQAHVGGMPSGRLHKGAEIPVDGPADILNLIQAVLRLCQDAG